MSNQPNHVTNAGLYWGVAIVLLAAYGGFVVLLWQVGAFDFPETDPAAEVLAAVVGLLGGLFAAILTFFGVLLKHSVDERNLALKEEAEERLKLENQTREERLKLETFIQAAGLLATDTGSESPRTQQAAALFALADLNQLRFALALLREMWPEESVSPSTACWLIDKCLRSNDEYLQIAATEILSEHAYSLATGTECFHWPDALWSVRLPIEARANTLVALGRCIKSVAQEQWSGECLATAVYQLVLLKDDDDQNIHNGAILFLDVLLGQSAIADWGTMHRGSEIVNLKELRLEISGLVDEARQDTYTAFSEIGTELEVWATSP